MRQPTPAELLGPAITEDYIPGGGHLWPTFLFSRNRPIFNYLLVREMLQDPRITYGLRLLKGPIVQSTQFEIASVTGEVDDYIHAQLERFWRFSAIKALKALEWGYSGHECLYLERGPYVTFEILKDMDPPDLTCVTYRGEVVGMKVRNVRGKEIGKNQCYVGIPKAFWHVHDRDRHPFYGLSRLYGCHVPWWEVWSEGGYRDVRKLWFHKNAFEGGVMYHPPGVTRLQDGAVVSNKDLARELIEKKRTGGVLTLPNTVTGPSGDARAWEYQPPQGNTIPSGLLEYGELLRTEELEAMGIPPEIVESQSSEGFGSSSGRQIPQMAFFSILQDIAAWLLYDFDKQILRHLVRINFGDEAAMSYEVKPLPLIETVMMSQEGGGDGQEEQEVDEDGNPIDENEEGEYEETTKEEKTSKDKSKKTTKTSRFRAAA